MKQRLEIGKVYFFNYKRNTPAIYNEPHVTARLNDKERQKLIHEINAGSEDIKMAYIAFTMQLTEYKTYLKQLETMQLSRQVLNGPYTRKTKQEIELEELVKSLKEKFFPKRTKKYTKREMVRGLFMRNLNSDNIEFSPEGKIKAMYAGKRVTKNCNVMHKWYVLGDAKVPVSVIEANELGKYVEVKW